MFLLKLAICVIFMAGTSYCMSPECYAIRQVECYEEEVKMKEMPDVFSDLETLCTNFVSLGHCIHRVMEKCVDDAISHDDEEDLKKFRNQLDFIETTCDGENEVYKVLSNNLLCVSSTINNMDNMCTWGGMNVPLYEKLYSLMDGKDEHPGCIIDAWVFYCLTARFDVECGSDVKRAVSEILDNIDYLSDFCKYMQQKVPYFEDAFVSEFIKGKRDQDAFPGVMQAIENASRESRK